MVYAKKKEKVKGYRFGFTRNLATVSGNTCLGHVMCSCFGKEDTSGTDVQEVLLHLELNNPRVCRRPLINCYNTNLSLCLTKHYAIKTYGEMEV
jgi:hypothetical protein